MAQVSLIDQTSCSQHPECNERIEGGSSFADVGRREVDVDALGRKRAPGIPNGTAHAVTTLADARVGEPNHVESGQPKRHIHLNTDRVGLDAKAPRCKGWLACVSGGPVQSAAQRLRIRKLESIGVFKQLALTVRQQICCLPRIGS